MKNFFSYFQRFQWKLTLSYVAVTMSTVIVLTGILVAIALYTESSVSARTFNSFYWSKTAFQDNIPFLLSDQKTLQSWLERVQQQGFTWKDFQSYVKSDSLDYANTLVKGKQPIYVLDANLRVIAAAPSAETVWVGQTFDSRKITGYGMESILDAAQTGDKNYTAQSFSFPDGNYAAAFPLRKSDEEPVSAYVIFTLKPVQLAAPTNLSTYTTFFILTAVVIFGTALPVGAIFGWLASRGLRKRLGNLSAAAGAWSKGDFSISPRDRSADEIGQLSRDLTGMAEQLQTLLYTRDELARVEERNRLARDLHDTVKQQTYAARMQLSAAKNLIANAPESAAEHLDAALQLNRETQQELKLIIDELRPAALQGKGLAGAITDYAARWQEHTGIQASTSISGERTLPLEIEQALYRMVQEGLANVARHADAESVAIMLRITPDDVSLSITDNGRGFDPSTVSPNSMGLAGMKQRLGAVGGVLLIESTLSVGTKLTAEVYMVPVEK